ncbi:hypothetical protein [Nesterenkonia pannonica]|uniref:hypothetical protein n=1 Tax=Nesterenkonia pannonica TaxID=1548602 RepID=UPI0021641613|nr:hypothetical protein [Nesterenkonia pannonica]
MSEGAAVEREPVSRPGEPLDPALVAALEREAARRGVSVVQLVHQQWPRERE